jgi:hypothetical protein
MDHQVFQKAIQSGGKLTVKSALNPILWLCGIISIPTIAANVFYTTLPLWISIIGCSPILMAMFGFMVLLFIDRDKLQSEDYQIKKISLEMSEQKGDSSPRLVGPSEILTTNPELPTTLEVLEHSDEKSSKVAK